MGEAVHYSVLMFFHVVFVNPAVIGDAIFLPIQSWGSRCLERTLNVN